MYLNQKIKVIMDLFSDTNIRLDVAQTIQFLFEVYSSGRADEENIRNDLHELLLTIVNVTRPELPQEEKANIANELTEDLFNAFKLESARRRMMAKYRLTTSI